MSSDLSAEPSLAQLETWLLLECATPVEQRLRAAHAQLQRPVVRLLVAIASAVVLVDAVLLLYALRAG